MNFSATYHPAEFLIGHCQEWIPGVARVQALYNKDHKVYYHDGMESTRLMLSDLSSIQLFKQRERKGRFSWVTPDYFISNESPSVVKQLNLEKELENHALLLFLLNPIDQLMDVFLIEFPTHVNPFRLKNSIINLTTDEKDHIGAVLFTVFSAEYNRIIHENQLAAGLSAGFSALQKELESVKNELNALRKTTQEDFDNLVLRICNELVIEEKIEVEVSFESMKMLRSMKLSESQLKASLSDALSIQRMANFGATKIVLTPYFIRAKSDTTISSTVSEKYDKVLYILDKYEAAATRITKEQRPVNGKNIARELEVTPPALTDAVKKNGLKIAVLLEKYPERWRIIRQYLKPVQRIDANLPKSA